MAPGTGSPSTFRISGNFGNTRCQAVTTATPTEGKSCCVNSALTRDQEIMWESSAHGLALSRSQQKPFFCMKWGSTGPLGQLAFGMASICRALLGNLAQPSAAFPPEEGMVFVGMAQVLLRQGGNCSVWTILRGFVVSVTTGCAVPLKCLEAASAGVPPVILRRLCVTPQVDCLGISPSLFP